MKLVISICTVDRPGQTYLGDTVRDLIDKGVPRDMLHLFPTHPDTDWIDAQVPSPFHVHRPDVPYHRNANGLRQVSVLDHVEADWLLMLEDDVRVCQDFLGSVERWIADYERPDVGFYRLLTLGKSRTDPTHGNPSGSVGAGARLWSNWEVRGAQAVLMRAEMAREFCAWGSANREHFRPTMAPFQTRREDGFDKMLGYWLRDTRPGSCHVVAMPNLVLHVGRVSSLHKYGERNEIEFRSRPYQSMVTA